MGSNFAAIILLLFVLSERAFSAKNLFFNASSAILEVDKPFLVTISSGAAFNLLNSTDAKVTGSVESLPDAAESGQNTQKNVHTLKIEFDKPIKGPNGTLDSAAITFRMTTNVIFGYWTLDKLDVAYVGQVNGAKVDVKESLVVAPKPGYTSKQVDVSCERGYTTCAPLNLCWSCSDQKFESNTVNATAGSVTSSLTLFSLHLQPNTNNATLNRFGYAWDCDPLIPLSIWVGLLLTLFLASVLYWAIDMLTGLMTPDRFDDPKGKSISVPTD